MVGADQGQQPRATLRTGHIIAKLSAALREAVNAPDTKMRMAADGTEPLPSTPEEYAADIDREETKWSAIVKKAGAKAE